jgi:hypothetical protein
VYGQNEDGSGSGSSGEWGFGYIGIVRAVNNCIQMANAVDLAALSSGRKYYTETATLPTAIAKNSADNNGEFIAWGVVIPQDRE